MAQSPVDGAPVANPGPSATQPTKEHPFAEAIKMSADKEAQEKAEKDGAAAGTPKTESVPVAKSDAAAVNDKVVEAKERTAEATRADVYHYFASRAETDWANLDEVAAAVNEPGPDGKRRAHVAKGVIEKILALLVDQQRLETEIGPSNTKRYRLTEMARRENDSPALMHGQRRAIFSVLVAGIVYTETDPSARVEGMNAGEIAYALMLGSAKGAEAEKARVEGRAPTLPDDTADTIRTGLASVPEKDPRALIDRTLAHLNRFLEAEMIEPASSEEATLEAGRRAIKEAGVPLAAPATTAKQPFVPTKKAQVKLFEEGVRAVVDETFPPRRPPPTVEELETAAEARAAAIVASLKKEAEAARTVADTHATNARQQTTKVLAMEAWLKGNGVKNPPELIASAVSKYMLTATTAAFETFDFEEEVTTDAVTAQRIQAEITALKAELTRVQNKHGGEKKAMLAVEQAIMTKMEDRVRIMEAWGNHARLTVMIVKRARTTIERGEIVVVSDDEHDRGRVLSRRTAPPGTQVTLPGAGAPNQHTPIASTVHAAVEAAAALTNGSNNPAVAGALDELKGTLAESGSSMTITLPDGTSSTIGKAESSADEEPDIWNRQFDLTMAGLKRPMEAFFLRNKNGIYEDELNERFFAYVAIATPGDVVVKLFRKLVKAALRAGTITVAEGGERAGLYWHKDNPDPRISGADKTPAATPTSKPQKPPGKGKKSVAGKG